VLPEGGRHVLHATHKGRLPDDLDEIDRIGKLDQGPPGARRHRRRRRVCGHRVDQIVEGQVVLVVGG
jgi:hypothetical protein